MDELAKSVFRLPWAMSLFGVQQIANLVAPNDGKQPTRDAEASLYSVVQTTQGQFNDALWAAFQVGDKMQREMVDMMWKLFTLEAFTPSYLSALGSGLARQSTETLRVMMPGRNSQVAWQQLKNSYEVFNLVKHVRDLLKIPAEGEFPLKELVERAFELGEYPDLWAVEGLGHDYAEHFWRHGEPVRHLLTDERASVLPARSLTMMHAGIGLCFAQRLMEGITPYSPASKVRDMLHEFVTLCDENSRKGYAGAAYESLGLLMRTWHPQMVSMVDRQLTEIAPDILSYFWRGVGRSYYFSPVFIVPGTLSPWNAVDQEPPHELGRLNARAGLAWATTVVNIRHPQIMEALVQYRGEQLAENDAFSNGIASSLIMSWDTTPGESYITKFCEYRPQSSDQRMLDQWDKLVHRPAEDAIQHYHPVLQEHNCLGEIFHYQSLADLVGRLENDSKSTKSPSAA